MPFTVTQASSAMMSSPSPINGAQDLHENLLLIGDAAFPGLSNQNELNWTELLLSCPALKQNTSKGVAHILCQMQPFYWRPTTSCLNILPTSRIQNLFGLRGILLASTLMVECSRGSVQAASNSPDPSLSPPPKGSGNQTRLWPVMQRCSSKFGTC